MPYPASKCFSNGPVDVKNASEKTDIKKSESLYTYFANNYWKIKSENDGIFQGEGTVPIKKNGSKYKAPVFINDSGCLAAVGGFNNDNYKLMYQISKGKRFCKINCKRLENIVIDPRFDSGAINYIIDGECISSELVNSLLSENARKSLCEYVFTNKEMWEATYSNMNLNINCIEQENSYNMGANLCLKDNNPDTEISFAGPTFTINKSANTWDNFTGISNNLNYITWPIPTVESNNPGVFYTNSASKSCTPCNGTQYPYKNNDNNICISKKFIRWDNKSACTYDFNNLIEKEILQSFFYPRTFNFNPIPSLFRQNDIPV